MTTFLFPLYLFAQSEEETASLGRNLASRLDRGGLVILDGPLGAGKTQLAAAIAESLGIPREKISSPTYTIMKPYYTDNLTIYHWDFYRVTSEEELFMADFDELLYEKGSLFLIEWGSLFRKAWDTYFPRYEITLSEGKAPSEREITVVLRENL